MTQKNIFYLIDESVNLDSIKKQMDLNRDGKFITFDFRSHKLLERENITHEKIEDYLNELDYEKIDDYVSSISVNWYKNTSIDKLLEYRDINLGSLLEIEMPSFFFPIVKNFYGVLRLFEKNKPTLVISSPVMSKIVKATFPETELITLEQMNSKEPSLVFDQIQIKFNIGKMPFRFNIKRHTFFKIKKLTENLTRSIFNMKSNVYSQVDNAVLLLDFNPLVYGNLLNELSKTNKQIFLLNQRRPAIQNLQSLKIIKNANCKILSLDDFLNDALKRKIETNGHSKLSQINKIWENDELLNKIFLVEGHSIWDAIKNNFIPTCNVRFMECISKLELAATMFEKIKFKCMLEWAHTATDEKIMCLEAKKVSIPTIFLQHGMMILNDSFEKFRKFAPFFPSNGAKIAVWGETMKNFNLGHGVSNDLILDTGSPRHDEYFSRKQKKKKSTGVILIAATSFFEINANGNDTNALIKFEKIIETICRTANKIPNKKLVVKMHPGQLAFDIKPVVHSIDPSIPIYHGKNILDLIETSDVVISLSLSTTILDAMIMDIPTITIIAEEQGFENEIPMKNNATLSVRTPEEFEKALHDALFDDKIRQELIQKGQDFVNNYMSHQGVSSKYLSEIISKY